MKKRNLKTLKYLACMTMISSWGVIAMDDEMPMYDGTYHYANLDDEDEPCMLDLLPPQASEPPQPITYEPLQPSEDFEQGLSHEPYLSSYVEDASFTNNSNSNSNSHSHSSTLENQPLQAALVPALVVMQHQLQKPSQEQTEHSSSSSSQQSSSTMDDFEDDTTPSRKAGDRQKPNELAGKRKRKPSQKQKMKDEERLPDKFNKSFYKKVSELYGQKATEIVNKMERSAQDKREGVWICPDSRCRKEISAKAELIIHIKRMHTDERDFVCEYCLIKPDSAYKAYVDESKLKAHIRKFHKAETSGLVQPAPVKGINTLMTTTAYKMAGEAKKCGNKLQCPTCGGKIVGTRSSLARHILSHTGEKPYICPLCNKGFANGTGLTQHISAHTGERPHKCTYCPKAFIRYGDLKDHMTICKPNPSSTSNSSSSSSTASNEQDEDIPMNDDENEDLEEEATSSSSNKHAGKKHARDEDEDYKEPSIVKKARAKK